MLTQQALLTVCAAPRRAAAANATTNRQQTSAHLPLIMRQNQVMQILSHWPD